jgi:hypothetical protein
MRAGIGEAEAGVSGARLARDEARTAVSFVVVAGTGRTPFAGGPGSIGHRLWGSHLGPFEKIKIFSPNGPCLRLICAGRPGTVVGLIETWARTDGPAAPAIAVRVRES